MQHRCMNGFGSVCQLCGEPGNGSSFQNHSQSVRMCFKNVDAQCFLAIFCFSVVWMCFVRICRIWEHDPELSHPAVCILEKSDSFFSSHRGAYWKLPLKFVDTLFSSGTVDSAGILSFVPHSYITPCTTDWGIWDSFFLHLETNYWSNQCS